MRAGGEAAAKGRRDEDLADGGAAADIAGGDRAGPRRHRGGGRVRPGACRGWAPSSPPCSARSSSRSAPTSPTTTPTPSAAPTPPTGSGRCGSPRPGWSPRSGCSPRPGSPSRSPIACGIYLATVAGIVILLIGAALDRRRRPLHRRPAALRLRRARRGLRLPLLRPGRRQRLLLRAGRTARRAAAGALDRGRLPRHRDPRRQQRPRPGDRPARGQDDAGGADGPRATRSTSTGCWCSAPSSSCRSRWCRRSAALLPLIGLLALPLAIKPMRAMSNRTDGPALNGALAATGALLARLQPAGRARAADLQLRRAERLSAMRLASVEVIPYALPFREPYVTARGTARRGARWCCCGCATRTGSIGLGEAVPLSLRGGATLDAGGARSWRRLGELDARGGRRGGNVGDAARLPPSAGTSAPARCAALDALLDLGERRPATATAAAHAPVPCNATLIAGRAGSGRRRRAALGEDGFTTFKLKLGAGDDVGAGRAVREAVGPGGADPGRRQRRLGPWRRRSAILAELEPLGDRARRAAGRDAGARRPSWRRATSIPLAGDESVETAPTPSGPSRPGACRLTGIKLSKVGGPEAAMRDRRGAARLRLQRPRRPGRDRARRRGRPDAARRAGRQRSSCAHGLATQRLFASTIAAVECELRDGMLHLPPGPGLGVEIDEEALDAHRL